MPNNLTLPLAQRVSSAVDVFSITNTGCGPAISAASTGGFTGLYRTCSHNGVVGEGVGTEWGVVGRSTGVGKPEQMKEIRPEFRFHERSNA
jgi:hypothetical protein